MATAVVVARAGSTLWHHSEVARLKMRHFSNGFLDRYLEQVGEAACETVGGYRLEALGVQLFEVIEGRKTSPPEGSYVGKLLQGGIDRIGKKVIEEAGETVIAAKNGVPAETIHEVADLWFHSLVLLSASGLTPADVWQELRSRRK